MNSKLFYLFVRLMFFLISNNVNRQDIPDVVTPAIDPALIEEDECPIHEIISVQLDSDLSRLISRFIIISNSRPTSFFSKFKV